MVFSQLKHFIQILVILNFGLNLKSCRPHLFGLASDYAWTYTYNTQTILGECLLISSLGLPGKASGTLVESRGLSSNSTCILEAESGKLDIKRCEPGILFIMCKLVHCLNQRLWRNCRFFCVDSASLATSFKKVQRHHGLIKAHSVR